MASSLLLIFAVSCLLGLAAGLVSLDGPEAQFLAFKQKYSKTYSSPAEEKLRFGIFKRNLAVARTMDEKEGNRNVYGVTRFSDMLEDEFKSIYLSGYHPRPDKKAAEKANQEVATPSSTSIPDRLDWHSLGGTTKVYDQGQCGSCWAFSTTEQIESMWWVAHPNQTIQSLSPQQIVDCDKGRGDQGCNGGDTTTAYEYVMAQGGLELWSDYPYAGENQKCKFNAADVGAKVGNWSYVTTTKNETEMLQYVGSTAPVSICVDAVTWQFYVGGVIEYFCGPADQLDHIVGYGDDIIGTHYWLIRNSWGELWGELGYLKVVRGKNLCGVAEEVTTCTVLP